MQMKFMKRREEHDRRERLRKEEEERLLAARWVVKSAGDDVAESVILILSEERFDLSPPVGRRSFRGFNPALETMVTAQLREYKQTESRKAKRRAKLALEELDAEKAKREEQSVTDAEMAQLAAKRKR